MANAASSVGITAMRKWAQDRLQEAKWVSTTLTERSNIAKYIGLFWDDGAFRTVYAYFNDSNERAELFLYQFYVIFFNESTQNGVVGMLAHLLCGLLETLHIRQMMQCCWKKNLFFVWLYATVLHHL